MRVAEALAVLALAVLAACARLGGPRGHDGQQRDVRVAGEPLSTATQARLLEHAAAGRLLYWRLPGASGPRCEAWRLVPEPSDPERGRLVLVPPDALAAAAADSEADAEAGEQPSPEHDPSASLWRRAAPAPSTIFATTPTPVLSTIFSEHVPSDIFASPVPSAIYVALPSPAVPSSPAPSTILAAWQTPVPSDRDTTTPTSAPSASSATPEPAPPDSPAEPTLQPDAPAPWASFPLAPAPRTRRRAPEPWTILLTPAEPDLPAAEPAPSDMSLGPSTMRLGYRLADGHLTLTAPEHEQPVAAPAGTQKARVHALTCVFTGVSLAAREGPRRLVLTARERFFFTADACAAAGFDDDPPGDDEVRALGCAGALADPATRARLERPPPATAPDATARLHRARAVHHLRRGPDGALVCDEWRNRPERAPGHGRLEHRGRDEQGEFVRSYAYDVGPGYLTLQGPAEFRRVRVDGRRTDVVRASSCIVTRGVTAAGPAAIDLAGERWYLSKRACDAARLDGALAARGASPLLVGACE